MNIVSRLTHKYVCVQLNLNMHINTHLYTQTNTLHKCGINSHNVEVP